MQRIMAVLATFVLALAVGAGSALAGGSQGGPLQGVITQTQSASNSVDQTATAKSTSVNASPNVAVLNFGTTDQSSSSSADADASNVNASQQSNDQQQSAEGSGSSDGCGCSGSEGSQTDQSQSASNSIDQTATAKATSVNASPNVAVLNFGKTEQSSSSSADANAGNANWSDQSNEQSQDATSGDGSDGTTSQTQSASNSIDQTAKAKAKSVNVSPNVAVLNFGKTEQSSSSSAKADAGNANWSDQSNEQSQQGGSPKGRTYGTYGKKDGKDCDHRSKKHAVKQDQSASNSVDQTAKAKAESVNASPNVAVLNFGKTEQSSRSSAKADAGNVNWSDQLNEQSQQGGSPKDGKDGKNCERRSNQPSVTQDQSASNSIDQTAKAKAESVNVSPNVAVLNFGKTDQSSSSSAEAGAWNLNAADQQNEQRQIA